VNVRRAALIMVLALAVPLGAQATPMHDMSVRIDPDARWLVGRDAITVEDDSPVTLVLAARFGVESVVVDGRRHGVPWKNAGGMQRLSLPRVHRVEVSWSGELAALDRTLEHRDTLSYAAPSSGPAGTYLPAGSGWYPAVAGSLERYRLTLDLPAGQRGLVPGRLLEESERPGRYHARFEFAQPAEGIVLLAGPYRIEQQQLRTAAGTQVRLRTYFHPQIAALARGYLESIAGYLNRYERQIGTYPFSEFSVVSSPTPTGFGMPTLTYLGIDVLRLPFIRKTSLGHEVLHNWWGNGVYPDYAHGNWSEGLTTFMADYAYRDSEGDQAATDARLAWLRDYASMPAADDSALERFTARTHGAAQVVGYNKAAMVFFMLRDAVGAAAFDDGIRRFWREQRFHIASWSDLRKAFEAASRKHLGTFFNQWISRTGAPTLHVANARAVKADNGWHLAVTLAQATPTYALSVPLEIRTSSARVVRLVSLEGERATAAFDFADKPLSVILDPEFRLFRRLGPSEAPPILREAILTGSPMLFSLSADPHTQAQALRLAEKLFERGGRGSASSTTTSNPVALVVGLHADIDEWLANSGEPGRPPTLAAASGSAQVWTVRGRNGRTNVMVSVRDASSLAALLRPLPHYGRQSWLIFDGARVIRRGVWPARPQEWKVTAASG